MKRPFACTAGLALAVLLPGFAAAQSRPSAQTPAKNSSGTSNASLSAMVEEANAAIEARDFPKAAALLEKFLASRPEEASARMQLGYAYGQMGRKDDARREFELVAAAQPKSALAHWNLGVLLLDSDAKAAVPPLQRAAALEPANAGYHAVLAVAYERDGRFADAARSYRTAAELRPNDGETRERLGRVLLAAQRPAEAEAAFRAALKINPSSSAAQLGLVQTLLLQKRNTEAASSLAEYLKSAPEDNQARLQYAELLLDGGKFQDALGEMDHLPAGEGSSASLLEMRVRALVGLKRFDEAVALQRKAAAAAPNSAEAHGRLGRLLLQTRDFTAAEKELRAALTLDIHQTDALRDLVAAYYLSERFAEALAAQDMLAKRETPVAGFWFIRAICFDKLKRKPEALEAYQKFLELEPDKESDHAFQARQRVRIIAQELKRK